MLLYILFALSIVLPGALTLVHLSKYSRNPEVWIKGMKPIDSDKISLFFNGELNLAPRASKEHWLAMAGATLLPPLINFVTYQGTMWERLELTIFMLIPGITAAMLTLQQKVGAGFDHDELEERMDIIGREVMEKRELVSVQAYLKGIASVRDRRFYPLIFELLVDWGGPETIGHLQKMRKEMGARERETKLERQVRDQIRRLQLIYKKQGKQLELPTMRKLLETGYWKRVFHDFDFGSNSKKGTPDRLLLNEGSSRIKTSLQHQIELQRAFPDVFCMRCHGRPVQQDLDGWTVVNCKRCNSVEHLEMGVKNVTGVIGPMENAPEMEGLVEVALWDAKDQKAMPADVDRIAIRSGGDFDYDWAVSAVLESLRNWYPDKQMDIPVALSAAVSLSPNTRSLMRGLRSS